MTSDVQQRRRRQATPPAAVAAGLATDMNGLDRLSLEGAHIRMRRGQRISISNDETEVIYVVGSGVLALEAPMRSRARQILAIYHAGDMFQTAARPRLDGEALRALSNGELTRAPWVKVKARAAAEPEFQSLLLEQLSRTGGRLARHVACIGGLSGPERVATFLMEEVRRSGQPSGTGMLIELVASRIDIADYLALNADTLSRIFGQLNERGLLQRRGRHRYFIPSLAALAALDPISAKRR